MRLFIALALTTIAVLTAPAVTAQDRVRLPPPPKELTPEERAQFVEATDRFRRWELPPLRHRDNTALGWIDNRRMLWTVRELPSGWKAADDERSKVVVVDVETGEVAETRYRGDLVCISPQRIVLHDDPRPYYTWLRSEGDKLEHRRRFAAGSFGDDLQAIEWVRGAYRSLLDCGLRPLLAYPGASYLEIPLLAEHGSLTVSLPAPGEVRYVRLVSQSGKELAKRVLLDDDGSPAELQFIEWAGLYYWPSASGRERSLVLVDPKGRFTDRRTPSLLYEWSRANVGSGVPVAVGPGVIWTFRTREGYFAKQGVYFETADRMLRIEAGMPLFVHVSPNGCRVFYRRLDVTRWRQVGNPRYETNVVQDLCEERAR
jgi:hypothetical protein